MNATNYTTRWNDMKVIVNEKDLPRGKGVKKKIATSEDTCYEDELNEFLEDSEYVPMSIPILKKRVWIPIKDELDP